MATYTLPDLAYDPSALEPHLAARIVELHHGKHHRTYVDGANATLDKLAGAREAGDYGSLVGLQKTLAFHVAGHVLHSILWTNLAPNAAERPGGDLAAAIDEHFGSFESFNKQLTAATLGVQGSGWGALAWEPTSGRLIVEQIYDHQGNIGQAAVPLLVIDSWEHAYYLQYRNVKADWLDAFWHLTNWTDVARRFAAARTVQLPY